MSGENIWLDWAVKLQSIAQAGLTYGKDKFDIERYEEIRLRFKTGKNTTSRFMLGKSAKSSFSVQ